MVVINGPAGVGKSSAAHRLAARNTSSAVVSGDALKGFIVDLPRAADGDANPARWVTYRTAARVVAEMLDSGFTFIVVDFVFGARAQFDAFLEALGERAVEITFVTLWASAGVLEARRKRRGVDDSRFRHLIDGSRERLAPSLDELGDVIETDGLDVVEVVGAIEKLLARP